MGRKKIRPVKRQKIETEEQEEVAKAIELLQQSPNDFVEAAAAEATRIDLTKSDRWIYLHRDTSVTSTQSSTIKDETRSIILKRKIPRWLSGLALARVSETDFVNLKKFFQMFKDYVDSNTIRKEVSSSETSTSTQWASWSGAVDDPRKRSFGFLPETKGYNPDIRNKHLDITMPTGSSTTTETEKHTLSNNGNEDENERARNKRAFLVFDKSEISDGVVKAIKNLCLVFRENLLLKDGKEEEKDDEYDYRVRLANCLRYENLIAAQPNLHAGRALLPAHLDDPRKDGFGVVILTIGMKDSGTIIFRDAKGLHQGVAMRLHQGEAYMLADRSRDACTHGVLADYQPVCIERSNGDEEEEEKVKSQANTQLPFSERESLNLRFGLHDDIIPMSMVLRHWDD